MYRFRFPALVFVAVIAFAYNLPDIADALLPTTEEGIQAMLFWGFSLTFAVFLSIFVWAWQRENRLAKARVAAAKAKKEAAPQAATVKA